MPLSYLLFDFSEGDDDIGLFDAMATVPAARAAQVQAEVDAVLAWASTFPGPRGPVEEGGAWEADAHDRPDADDPALRCFTLSISGCAAFCAAFLARFGDAVA